MSRIICVHQPAFLPWLGLIESMFVSDIFVHLDDVQFEDGGFQNRNRIKTAQGVVWLSMPVQKQSFTNLAEIQVSSAHQPKKMMRAIKVSYEPTPHFDTVMRWLEPHLTLDQGTGLMEANILFLESLAQQLGAPCQFKRASRLRSPGSGRLANIAALMRACNARYLCTGFGMQAYTTETEMKAHGISPIWHGFEKRDFTYPQLFPKLGFIANLSVIDMLFNCGFDATATRLSASARAIVDAAHAQRA
ncbi:MAG: WbqC family protein [Litoreibacter sp.]|uniref:WbqC family protein n=1 Tax=Litoreibacter sp. TaxID=1969459 RepID=UPI003296E213